MGCNHMHRCRFVPVNCKIMFHKLNRHYRPQTKLQEVNVFTGVCLFTGGVVGIFGPMFFLGVGISGTRSFPGGGYVQGGWVYLWVCLGNGYVQGWVCPGVGTFPLGMGSGIPQDTVGKWVVHILLECFLVIFVCNFSFTKL